MWPPRPSLSQKRGPQGESAPAAWRRRACPQRRPRPLLRRGIPLTRRVRPPHLRRRCWRRRRPSRLGTYRRRMSMSRLRALSAKPTASRTASRLARRSSAPALAQTRRRRPASAPTQTPGRRCRGRARPHVPSQSRCSTAARWATSRRCSPRRTPDDRACPRRTCTSYDPGRSPEPRPPTASR